MNEEKSIQKVASNITEKSKKKLYKQPEFREYGALHLRTQGSGGFASDSSVNMTKTPMSDRRAKENIVKIGTHPLGFGLYLFEFKKEFSEIGGNGRQFGVMADEVEGIIPEAVTVGPHGFKTVNYQKIGISLYNH